MTRSRSREEAEMTTAAPGRNLFRLVAVSFGLLCVLQAALNISLRLYVSHSETPDPEASCKNLTEDRDELKRKLSDLTRYLHKGWKYFNGSVYYISSTMKTWQESRKYCLERDADLMKVDSKEEQDFTRQFTRNGIWIGLSDRENNGVWTWVDGTPLTTSFWRAGEPRNEFNGQSEDCVEIIYEDTIWNDMSCKSELYWICEKKMVP